MITPTPKYSLTSYDKSNPLGRGRPKCDFLPSEIDELTDEQLLGRFASQPHLSLSQTEDICGANNIIRLLDYPSIVIKRGLPITSIPGTHNSEYLYPSEAYALQLIFEYTTIPVPRLRRVLNDPTRQGGGSLIFMDSIPGRQLRDVWPTMTIEEKLKAIFTMRNYVSQMRSISTYYRHPRSKVAGPLALGDVDVAANGYSPMFVPGGCQQPGPFKDGKEFAEFMTDRALDSEPSDMNPGIPESLFPNISLILTHQDLLINMRNILVGDDGRLYLIDWTHAGFYPPYFELACARILHSAVTGFSTNGERDSEAKRSELRLWDMMIPYICGPSLCYAERR